MPRAALHLLILILACAAAAVAADDLPLETAAQVRALAPDRAAKGVRVIIRGTVTSIRGSSYPEFILQDGTGGVIAHLPRPVGEQVRVGQQVEIEGVTSANPPTPRILVKRMEAGAMVGMPEPRIVKPGDLASGLLDCTFIELSGVVRSSRVEETIEPRRLVLDLGPTAQRLTVWVSHFDDGFPALFPPDTAVTVRGIANTWRTSNFQPFSNFIVVSDPARVTITSSAPADPFAGEPRTIPELLTRPVENFTGRRELTRGVVTLSWPGEQMILQGSNGALRIRGAGRVPPGLGDELTVTGFPARDGAGIVLEDAVFGPAIPKGMPRSLEISPGRLLAEAIRVDRDARLVRVSAVVKEITHDDRFHLLQLESGSTRFSARLPKVETLPAELTPGANVELEGAVRMQLGSASRSFGRPPETFTLELPDARAVRLLGNPSWWTPARAKRVTVAAVATVLLALGWAFTLHRRAARRSRLLIQEIRARHDAELLAAERMRLASDLHDTLSQSLSGAALQLEVANRLVDSPGQAEVHFSLARRLLDRSREDLRRTVWDLSPSALQEEDLAGALQRLACEVPEAAGCEVSAESDGRVELIPERIRTHLFRAGQEALHNALRHSGAREIRIHLQVTATGITLRISDDGHGFDPATVPGPEHGHFGLRSLRERITRLGGQLHIDSSPAGTTIRATVPLDSQLLPTS